MKIPICKCEWMLASKTIEVFGMDEGRGVHREEIAWVCVNKDCEEYKFDSFVTPNWVDVDIRQERKL